MASIMFSGGQLPPNLPQFQTRKALFIIEIQNDFISKDGKCPVKTDSGFVRNIKALVPAFRGVGDVVWVRSEFKEPKYARDPPEIDTFVHRNESALSSEDGSEDDDDSDGRQEDEDRSSTESEGDGDDDAEEAYQLSSVGSPVIPRRPEIVISRRDEESKPSTKATPTTASSEQHPAATPGTAVRPADKPQRSPSPDKEGPICCVPGSWGADFIDDIEPTLDEEKDRFIIKSCYSAFDDTSLLSLLRTSFVTELYICGSRSHASVYATAVDAAQHGFGITVVEDCLGFLDGSRHLEAVRQMADVMGADGISSSELILELKGPATKDEKGLGREQSPGTSHISGLGKALSASSESVHHKETEELAPLDDVPTTPERRTDMDAGNSDHSLISPIAAPPFSDSTQDLPQSPPDINIEFEGDDVKVNGSVASQVVEEVESEPVRTVTACDYDSRGSSPAPGVRSRDYRPHDEPLPIRVPVDHGTPLFPTSRSDLGPSASDAHFISPTTGDNNTLIPPISPPANVQTDSPGARSQARLDPSLARTTNSPRVRKDMSTLGLGDRIGEGDSEIIYDILPLTQAEDMFRLVKEEVQWQTMHHRTGVVPRLVAVQGDVNSDGSVPLYRHPADESPPLRPFSATVSSIREAVVKVLRQPLNHVLIQLYRDGEDNISEHSDKTLDIVHGSKIVNVSLGAQRIMTLRTKKQMNEADNFVESSTNDCIARITARSSQRIALPHNSMFVLGQKTNMRWLHGIRPDKRPSAERSPAELAFCGERISLTFRHIGTFLSQDSARIWGQGARSKSKADAGRVLNGESAEAESMIRAFGRENRQSEFDWDEEYGRGFDVLNFVTTSGPAASV